MQSEVHSIDRPLIFNGSNFSYWKKRMIVFIQSQDMTAWKIVLNGLIILSIVRNGRTIPKLENDYNDDDWRSLQTNTETIDFLYCALSLDIFNKVLDCDSAKKIWDKLQENFEGE
ncbi:hypothetical protein U1Q18_052738 [Sarracenia purpurea var. burkii]